MTGRDGRPFDALLDQHESARETIDLASAVLTSALGTDPRLSVELLRGAAARNAVPLRMLARHVVAEAPTLAPDAIAPWLRRLLAGAGRAQDAGGWPVDTGRHARWSG